MDLTRQGDPGTLESDSAAARIHLPTRTEMMAMWEEQRVISSRIDFVACRSEWSELTSEHRASISSTLHALKRIDRRRVPLLTSLSGRAPQLLDESALWGTFVSDSVRHIRLLERFCRDARIGPSERPAGLDKLLDDQLATIARACATGSPLDELRALAADALGVVGIIYLGLALLLGRDLRRHHKLDGLSRALDRIADDKHRYVGYACVRLLEGQDEGLEVVDFGDLGPARIVGSEIAEKMCEMVPASGFLGDDDELVPRCQSLSIAALERRLIASGDL